MSFLTPLYIAGLAAVSLPILFHLIRRTPRGSVTFSSLMFITPTPPRLTRRSRLDQILLLLLRGLALALLALAFARPFWRELATIDESDLGRRWVALLVDTSASMQREGVWQQAERAVDDILRELGPHDWVALYAYDHQVRELVGFQQSRATGPAERIRLVRGRFEQLLKPGWGESNLGSALVYAADELDALSEEGTRETRRQVIVISDLQDGSEIEALQAYQWPNSVSCVVRQVAPAATTNATLQLLHEPVATEDDASVRVRVINAADSRSQRFEISWAAENPSRVWDTIGVAVPPGESRVVRMKKPGGTRTATQLLLTGDDHDFDNRYYVVPVQLTESEVVYVGDDDADDPDGLRYYLQRGLTSDPWQPTRVSKGDTEKLGNLMRDRPALVTITRSVAPENIETLRDYLAAGGTILMVVRQGGEVMKTFGLVTGRPAGDAEDVELDDYAMLSEIDFRHPLFSPFANPLYNDFTNIFFWRYRRLNQEVVQDATILARFDTGDPALLEVRDGPGRLYLLTSGWHPDDSQLARSTKFVPLVSRLAHPGETDHNDSFVVDEPVPLPAVTDGEPPTVTRPDGTEAPVASGESFFRGTQLPGVYQVRVGEREQRFAVNLPLAETRTAPLDVAQLEQRGVRLGAALTRAEELATLRQMRDIELEARQNYWQWLIAAALIVVIVETVVAARHARAGVADLGVAGGV